MRQVLLIVDVQSTFSPPEWLVDGLRRLSANIPTIASVELHDEQVTPFERQLGWHPAAEDESLVEARPSLYQAWLRAERRSYRVHSAAGCRAGAGVRAADRNLRAGRWLCPVRCGADAYPGDGHDRRLFAGPFWQAGHRVVAASLPSSHYLGRGTGRTGRTDLTHVVTLPSSGASSSRARSMCWRFPNL
ncbi:hypothetical protein TCK1_1969 [Pseudomonas monteilii]|uniref:Isochorismatase family protein n=1 Tax=Pseudomonas monteilii TaxID=76759 RepID=A0AAE6RBU4_9PSED|nr:hypothetical protein TCK1_1969 [Pseudomonas monteilii]